MAHDCTAQCFDFLGDVHAQPTVRSKRQHPRQAHGAGPAERRAHAELRLVLQPCPHDAAALTVLKALRGEERVVHPAHPRVELGVELFVSPLANVVAAAETMADAEQHVLVAELEQIGAGDVLVQGDAVDAVGEQVAHVAPLAVGADGLRNRRPSAAEDGVAAVAFLPSERIPGTVFAVVLVALLGLWRDRPQLPPLVQLVVERHGEGVPLPHLVVAHRRHAALADEAVAAVHPFEQPGGVMSPVEQIRAGCMAPVVRALVEADVLEDVEQVVAALPVDGAVGIEGHGDAFGDHEVVAGARRVEEHLLAQAARVLRRRIALPAAGDGHATPRAIRLLAHLELEEAAAGGRTHRHWVDAGRGAVQHHLGGVQKQILGLVAATVDLLAKLFAQLGLAGAGAAAPGFREERQHPFEVRGTSRLGVALQRRQHLLLHRAARRRATGFAHRVTSASSSVSSQ